MFRWKKPPWPLEKKKHMRKLFKQNGRQLACLTPQISWNPKRTAKSNASRIWNPFWGHVNLMSHGGLSNLLFFPLPGCPILRPASFRYSHFFRWPWLFQHILRLTGCNLFQLLRRLAVRSPPPSMNESILTLSSTSGWSLHWIPFL